MPIIRRKHAYYLLDNAAKSTRFDRTRGDENVKLVAHNYNFVETRDARLVFQTQSSSTLPYLTFNK